MSSEGSGPPRSRALRVLLYVLALLAALLLTCARSSVATETVPGSLRQVHAMASPPGHAASAVNRVEVSGRRRSWLSGERMERPAVSAPRRKCVPGSVQGKPCDARATPIIPRVAAGASPTAVAVEHRDCRTPWPSNTVAVEHRDRPTLWPSNGSHPSPPGASVDASARLSRSTSSSSPRAWRPTVEIPDAARAAGHPVAT